jgi:hypothetical protein
MRLNVKKDQLTQKLVAEYLARGGTIKKEDAQTATKRLKRALSLGSRHVGKHNGFGQRV